MSHLKAEIYYLYVEYIVNYIKRWATLSDVIVLNSITILDAYFSTTLCN